MSSQKDSSSSDDESTQNINMPNTSNTLKRPARNEAGEAHNKKPKVTTDQTLNTSDSSDQEESEENKDETKCPEDCRDKNKPKTNESNPEDRNTNIEEVAKNREIQSIQVFNRIDQPSSSKDFFQLTIGPSKKLTKSINKTEMDTKTVIDNIDLTVDSDGEERVPHNSKNYQDKDSTSINFSYNNNNKVNKMNSQEISQKNKGMYPKSRDNIQEREDNSSDSSSDENSTVTNKSDSFKQKHFRDYIPKIKIIYTPGLDDNNKRQQNKNVSSNSKESTSETKCSSCNRRLGDGSYVPNKKPRLSKIGDILVISSDSEEEKRNKTEIICQRINAPKKENDSSDSSSKESDQTSSSSSDEETFSDSTDTESTDKEIPVNLKVKEITEPAEVLPCAINASSVKMDDEPSNDSIIFVGKTTDVIVVTSDSETEICTEVKPVNETKIEETASSSLVISEQGATTSKSTENIVNNDSLSQITDLILSIDTTLQNNTIVFSDPASPISDLRIALNISSENNETVFNDAISEITGTNNPEEISRNAENDLKQAMSEISGLIVALAASSQNNELAPPRNDNSIDLLAQAFENDSDNESVEQKPDDKNDVSESEVLQIEEDNSKSSLAVEKTEDENTQQVPSNIQEDKSESNLPQEKNETEENIKNGMKSDENNALCNIAPQPSKETTTKNGEENNNHM